ncbi:P-loop containing nucleoside triphosphate hydrolase protein [Teratosphaeria destructans]|uniref:P-loop containing nucleoside triphosphate hydrolase protein n=1 Tax=Teratosphaeria destructans TaxID=418781 RepID=A0A9W7SP51_9PEZI|nr:P-loop containing nucleoside triphosphate hydrolase protein [Teratosphaeria destructans]
MQSGLGRHHVFPPVLDRPWTLTAASVRLSRPLTGERSNTSDPFRSHPSITRHLISINHESMRVRWLNARPSYATPRLPQGTSTTHVRPASTWSSSPSHAPTIYALSTAPGRAAIAVIRVSGPAWRDIYRALCPGKAEPKPRYATLRSLYAPGLPPTPNTVLDSSALILHFPAPRTVTGEDVLELHVHGGPAVVKAVLAAVSKCGNGGPGSGIRYAEPGEFTRRAFMNDKLDLTRVEALGDMLAAMTEQQRWISMRGNTNGLAKRYEGWRQQLLYARGELEALIDFSEDQHFDESPAELCASVAEQVRALKAVLQVHEQNAVRGELLRNGISISLLGAPNAGKSSLLNRIVGRDAAIVSQEAGTTRDVVEVGLDLGGYFCRLGDTAGLRKAREEAMQAVQPHEMVGQIEREGMRRAKARAAESDVVIVVLSFEAVGGEVKLQLDPEVVATAAGLVKTKNNVLVVVNKTDMSLNPRSAIEDVTTAIPGLCQDRIHLISCRNAALSPTHTNGPTSDPGNIQAFLHRLIQHFSSLTTALVPSDDPTTPDASVWQESLGATERHRLLLEESITYLDSFLSEVQSTGEDADVVLAAEHLRGAAECLAKITGKGEAGDVEEVLGVVFEKFCVGK